MGTNSDKTKVECVEPLMTKVGNSHVLKVPSSVKLEHPNWKFQNPRAFIRVEKDAVQLIYEWKAFNGVIINNEE